MRQLRSCSRVRPARRPAASATFTDRTLSSLSEVQRLPFVIQMTRTEYERPRSAGPDSADHYPLLANSASIVEARQTARSKLEGLGVENVVDYARIWASDYLSDEQLRRFADCVSSRQPGLTVAGRSESPGRFHLTFAHITPIGIEKITTRLVASHNIANLEELEAFLAALGARDNYTARTFPLQLADPAERAVLVLRAGWETPKFVYIPVYPTPDYFD